MLNGLIYFYLGAGDCSLSYQNWNTLLNSILRRQKNLTNRNSIRNNLGWKNGGKAKTRPGVYIRLPKSKGCFVSKGQK